MSNLYCVKGNIIYTKEFGKYEVVRGGYILVNDNVVSGVYSTIPSELKNIDVIDYGDSLIIPGFVDLHLHAPQFPNIGLGLDKELIPWLETYTFPEESKYNDLEYAKKVYSKLIRELWKYGTTRSCVFATVHKNSTKLLIELFNSSGLGAFVGKINMDSSSPDSLLEDTDFSLSETESLLIEYRDKYKLVKPIITPRFVPTCSYKLLKSLGELAIKYNIPVQSHLSENKSEVSLVKIMYPNKKNYSDIYDSTGLLGDTKTIMAHCVLLDDDEIELISKKGVFVAHCPASNVNLSSGIAPIRKLISSGVKVGLATDISGGHTLSMTNVIQYALQMSNLKWIESGYKEQPLNTAEAFYLATKGSGEFFGRVGSFEEGYDFDALVIDDNSDKYFKELSIEERLQKFIYSDDFTQIKVRYVAGKVVSEPNI